MLEVADVDFEVDFDEVEVTSVVDGFTVLVEVLVDEALVGEVVDDEVLDEEAVVELLVDVSTGRHWPAIVSGEVRGCGLTYCANCSGTCTHSLVHMK